MPFKDKTNFQVWISQVKNYVLQRCGSIKRHRLYVYTHAGVTHFAFDIFSTGHYQDMSITIAVTTGYQALSQPIDGQLDMELPDVVAVMDFITNIIHCDEQTFSPSRALELLPWAQPAEKPHARVW